MRTLFRLLTACAFAGVIGAAATAPAAAQMNDRHRQTSGGYRSYNGYRTGGYYRGDRDRDRGSNFSLGFYGGYPYYVPSYTGYYGSPYYGYSNYDCDDSYYGSYYDTDECDY
jgi:hypothetical protein